MRLSTMASRNMEQRGQQPNGTVKGWCSAPRRIEPISGDFRAMRDSPSLYSA